MAKYSYLDSAFRSLSTLLISFIPGDNKEKDETKDILFTPDNKHQILCNNTRTLKEYRINLDKYFKSFRALLESEINDYQTKGEYLFLLNNFSTEIRSIKNLINSESLSDSSAYLLGLIKFTDMPEGYGILLPLAEVDYKSIPLNAFSEHIQYLSLILNETENYITNHISIITATPSSDLPLKSNIPPKADVSTLKEPLRFFNHLILNNGLYQFKQDFFHKVSGHGNAFYYDILDVNESEESYTYLDVFEDGSPKVAQKVFLRDELNTLLDVQLVLSNDYLDQLVSNSQADSKKVSSILDLHLTNCLGLMDFIKSSPELKVYPYINESLSVISKRMVDKYSTFINIDLCNKVDSGKFEIPIFEKLTWNDSADSFALFFKDSLESKKITLKDVKAAKQLFEKLSSFFNVLPKSKGVGRPTGEFVKESVVVEKLKNTCNIPKT